MSICLTVNHMYVYCRIIITIYGVGEATWRICEVNEDALVSDLIGVV